MRIRGVMTMAGGIAVGLGGCKADLSLPPDTTAPVVTFEVPTNGQAVNGVVGIKVTASDDDAVERVKIFIDGTLRGTFYLQPYYVQWTVQNLPDGSSHTLRAEALDPSGNTGSAEITVTVVGGPG